MDEAADGGADGAMCRVPSPFALAELRGLAHGVSWGVARENGNGFGNGAAMGGFCKAPSNDVGGLLKGVSEERLVQSTPRHERQGR